MSTVLTRRGGRGPDVANQAQHATEAGTRGGRDRMLGFKKIRKILDVVSLTGTKINRGAQAKLVAPRKIGNGVFRHAGWHGGKTKTRTTRKGTIMADEKTGKKPEDKQGGKGGEKGGDSGEVGGRGSQLLYTCFNDGAGNYVSANWTYFTCWRCGALNYM